MQLQIFDLDGSLTAQASLRDAAPWRSVQTFDLRDVGPRLRLWARAAAIEQARARIADASVESSIMIELTPTAPAAAMVASDSSRDAM